MGRRSVDICYVISHGFAARMLLQTGLIRRLADSGLQVAIITPDPDDENLAEFHDQAHVQLYGSNDKVSIWNDDYLFKRKYFLEDLSKNPALWEKHVYSLYYSPSLHPWRRLRPLYYYLSYALIKHFPAIRQRFIDREHQYLRSDNIRELLQQIAPRLVVSTYPVNFLEAQVLFAAQQLQIPTLIHLLSWDNISCKGRFPVTADQYIVWGEIMYRELQEYYGVADEKIHTCGVPHFDHHIRVKEQPVIEGMLSELGLQAEQPYLLVAMSAPRFAPREIDIVEWLAEEIAKDAWGPDLQLVIRPHPQNVQGFMADGSWLPRLQALSSERVAIDLPRLVDSKLRWSMQKGDMDRLSNLLAGCSICLNSGSTVSIDALMLDKPVILTSFDAEAKIPYWRSARRLIDYTHLKKFVALGGVSVIRTFTELRQTILDYLQDPALHLAARQYALQQQCYRNDGKATERVLDAMHHILESIAEKV